VLSDASISKEFYFLYHTYIHHNTDNHHDITKMLIFKS